MLSIDTITTAYDELTVLRELSLQLSAGKIHCLMGRNGAGKSTLLNTIMGLLPIRSGRMSWHGRDITRLPAHDRPTLGMGYVPQGRRLFGEMTVGENLEVALIKQTGQHKQRLRERSLSLFPLLKERLTQRSNTLSGGEQQMLATARALCVEPKLLLMDEPTEGLQPSMVEIIRNAVVTLADEGVATLLVEQRSDAVLPIADCVTFIENGQLQGTYTGQAARSQPELIRQHLGIA
ncbi:MAG: ABC transporter ATP-binding protein [Granulosicoccus sp.]